MIYYRYAGYLMNIESAFVSYQLFFSNGTRLSEFSNILIKFILCIFQSIKHIIKYIIAILIIYYEIISDKHRTYFYPSFWSEKILFGLQDLLPKIECLEHFHYF